MTAAGVAEPTVPAPSTITRRLPARWWPSLLYILGPALILGGVAAWQQGVFAPAAPTDLPALFPDSTPDWAAHIAALDAGMEVHRFRSRQEPSDWLSPAAEAAALLDRAQLTGRWQDLAAAQSAMATSMARAPDSAKPHPLGARLALALHRNRAVEPALAAATIDLENADIGPQSEAAMLRGDVALYAGDWRRADQLYRESYRLADDPSVHLRRALIVERTGEADAAIAAIIAATHATQRPSRRLLSHAAARIGNVELARGNWEDAARWYARADRYLPGDWRVVALRLQMQAMGGDLAGATGGMAALAARHDLPLLWDALASWQRAAGDSAAAAASSARAAAGWQLWLARYPEAAFAHAAEHDLGVGDSAAALAHARANYANRPYGDAAILLAMALSASGDVAEARAVLTRTTASGWRTVESDRLAFELAALAGDAPAAEAARAAALARNPRAFDPAMALVRFGLH